MSVVRGPQVLASRPSLGIGLSHHLAGKEEGGGASGKPILPGGTRGKCAAGGARKFIHRKVGRHVLKKRVQLLTDDAPEHACFGKQHPASLTPFSPSSKGAV